MDATENRGLKLIHQRKSVRQFTNQKVSKEVLRQIVRAGMAAPSAVNKQPWAFVVVDNENLLKQLADQLPYAKMAKQAAAVIVVCGDLQKALPDWQQEFWVQDCSAATQNILLAIEAFGLGAVWTAAYPAMDRVNIVASILNLPDNLIPLNVIPLGYPLNENTPMDKWDEGKLHWNAF